MIVLDSSCWIEIAVEGELEGEIKKYIKDYKDILTPTIVVYEVSKILKREASLITRQKYFKYILSSKIIPLDEDMAISASEMSLKHNLPMADAIIYTTGRSQNADIVTLDEDLKDLPGVIFIE